MSVPTFYQKHDLNPNYFYGRKSIFHNAEPRADFIQAHVISQQTTLISEQLSSKASTIELSLPDSTSAPFLAKLLNGLAS